jgi:hypothetical protein
MPAFSGKADLASVMARGPLVNPKRAVVPDFRAKPIRRDVLLLIYQVGGV